MSCSDEAWRGLWTDFNRLTTDSIRVNRLHLREILACHDGVIPDDKLHRDGLLASVPREGGATVLVNRTTLFNFLRYHGAVCGRA